MAVNLKDLVKSPQALVSLAAAAVVSLGTAGIIDTNLSGALQTLLGALLAVITALGHSAATVQVAAKQQATPSGPDPVPPSAGPTAGG